MCVGGTKCAGTGQGLVNGMKRKRLIIGSAIAVVLVGAAIVVGWNVWLAIHGAERLAGSRQAIPRAVQVLRPVEQGPADWPCWRGPAGDGKSSVVGIRKDWSGGLTRRWEVSFLCQGTRTATWSSPVVCGNRLVVPGRDADNDLVFCLDCAGGDLIWSKSYPANTGTSHGPGPRATPFIDQDRAYTFGRGGDLACWRLLDGELLWKQNVTAAGGKEPTWGHSASPVVYEDKVFVQGGGGALVIAYDKMTGRLAWKSMEGQAGYASLTLLKAEGATRLLAFHGAGLSCLDPSDGAVLWTVPWKTSYGVNATTPAVAGATIFITSGYNTGCQAIESQDGRVQKLWQSKVIASQHSDPIIIDGFIYGYSGQSDRNAGRFKCVELQTGREKWSTDTIGWGTTLYVDGHLLCMDIKGNLFLIKPNPDRFEKITEFKAALGELIDPAWTPPVVANGRLFLRYMQRLVCYDLMPQEPRPPSP
jgi:outer membrane protein assembly factor BamB